jgi:hypothetical protein
VQIAAIVVAIHLDAAFFSVAWTENFAGCELSAGSYYAGE